MFFLILLWLVTHSLCAHVPSDDNSQWLDSLWVTEMRSNVWCCFKCGLFDILVDVCRFERMVCVWICACNWRHLRCFLFMYICLNCKTRSQQADNVLSSCVRGLMTHLLYVLAHALDCCCPQAPPVSVSQQRLTPAALVACPHQKQQRDCTHSRWVSKHAKKRDPCCDVGKPSTELNKCTNSN